MPSFRIRPATAADMPAIVVLADQWAAEGVTRNYKHTTPTVDGYAARLNDACFVAKDDSALVGFIMCIVKTSGGPGPIQVGEKYDDLP